VTLFREEAARISRFNKRPPFPSSSHRDEAGGFIRTNENGCKTARITRAALSSRAIAPFYSRTIGEHPAHGLITLVYPLVKCLPIEAREPTTDIMEAKLLL